MNKSTKNNLRIIKSILNIPFGSALLLTFALFLCACSGGDSGSGVSGGSSSGGSRTTKHEFLAPEASGESTLSGGAVTVDTSHTSDGYIMINYTGGAEKLQVQITNPDGEVYPYPMVPGDYRTFPLTGGSGNYKVEVLEHVTADMYSMAFSNGFEASISDEFTMYLYPNQYVDFRSDSSCVALGIELSDKSSDDIDYVTKVYDYVISNISYDEALAASAPVNQIPDPDATLSSKKGICFDYASLMSAMLRSQGIPTKLVVGYSGTAYHAWISVYLTEIGWVENVIEFDGSSWSLMDPTLAANNDASAVAQYVGDGSNYTVRYTY